MSETSIPHNPTEARASHLESLFWRRALLWGLRAFPHRVRQASIPLWAAFFYAQVPHGRRALESNLGRLLEVGSPGRELWAFRTFTNYCRCIANSYGHLLGQELELSRPISGLSNLRAALAHGRGAVLATGHLGNWHLGPHFLRDDGLPPVTVVMHQEPDSRTQQLEQRVRDSRMTVVYSGRDPMVSLSLRGVLARGELVAFQMDRGPGDGASGIRVPCAGGEVTFAAGPALLARVCDAPVVPAFFPLEGDGVRTILEPPVWAPRSADRRRDMYELTARLAGVYERMIRRYPDQWFTFYDFWGA